MFSLVFGTSMLTDICITTALLWQLNRSGLYSRQNMQTKRYLSFYDRHISRRLSIPPLSS